MKLGAPLVTLACISTSACYLPEDHSYTGGLRVAFTVVDEFEGEASGPGATLDGDVEYDAFDIAPGLVTLGPDGRKLSTAELQFSNVEFGDLDAFEFSGGGRIYMGRDLPILPFLSIYSVGTFPEDVLGVDTGVQLGIRPGLGFEIPLGNTGAFLDVGADYTFPILPAETDSFPEVESEYEGFAIRVGVGFAFLPPGTRSE